MFFNIKYYIIIYYIDGKCLHYFLIRSLWVSNGVYVGYGQRFSRFDLYFEMCVNIWSITILRFFVMILINFFFLIIKRNESCMNFFAKNGCLPKKKSRKNCVDINNGAPCAIEVNKSNFKCILSILMYT